MDGPLAVNFMATLYIFEKEMVWKSKNMPIILISFFTDTGTTEATAVFPIGAF